jgi:hypothetical protein
MPPTVSRVCTISNSMSASSVSANPSAADFCARSAALALIVFLN